MEGPSSLIGTVPGISPLDRYSMRAFAALGVLYSASLKAVKEGRKEVLYVILDGTLGREGKKKKKPSNCAYHIIQKIPKNPLLPQRGRVQYSIAHVKLP